MFGVSVVVTLLNLLTGLYVARTLPTADYGRLVYFSNLLLTAMLLIGFGLTTFVAGELARLGAGARDEEVSRSFYSIFAARAATALPLPLLGLAAARLLGDPVFFAAGLGAALAVTLDFCIGTLQGIRQTRLAAAAFLAQPLSYMALLAAVTERSAEAIMGALLASYALALLIAAAMLGTRRVVRRPGMHRSWAYLRRSVRQSGLLYLIALVQISYGTYALIWLGSMGRYVETALLGIYLTIARMFPLALVPIIGTVVYPRLCAAMARGNLTAVRRQVSLAFEVTAALTLCATALMVAYPALIVELLYSAAYVESAFLLRIVAPLCLVLALEQLLSYALLAIGRPGVALGALTLRLALFAVAAAAIVRANPADATAPLALAYLASSVVGLLLELGYYLWWSRLQLPLLRLLAFGAVCAALAGAGRALLPEPHGSLLVQIYRPLVTGLALVIAGAAMLYRTHRHPGAPARIGLGLLVAGLALAGLLAPPPAAAAPPGAPAAERCEGTAAPPNRVVIRCAPGFASERDTITVYLRDGFVRGLPWQEQIRAEEAVWVFHEGPAEDGRTLLLIDFHRDGPDLVADLYTDGDGDADAEVSWILEGTLPRPLESRGRWVLRAVALDGWWQRGEQTSFNLRLLVDGPIRGSFGAGFLYDYRELLKTDGTVDFVINVRDRDGDGRPDYEWRQDYPPLPEDFVASGYYRTHLMVNPEDDERPLSEWLLWPLLSGEPPGDILKGTFHAAAPIQLDWAASRIVQIGELVSSRHNPGNYFIYSIPRAVEGRLSVTNFENPFAYYDLAGANDGYPDMTIRMEVTLPGEIAETLYTNDEPINIVEFAWDEDHSQQWDYGLTLAGQQSFTHTITLPDLAVTAIPPDVLPGWAVGESWDAATFVEIEVPYFNNETIYEYTVELGGKALTNRYMQGLLDAPPTAAFTDPPEGFRGEYALSLGRQPYLYLSPVDGRLHLQYADGGVWHIDAARTLRSANLDGDAVLDQWQLVDRAQPERTLKELNVGPTTAIYSDPGRVALREVAVAPMRFESLPPTDNASWRALRDRTAAAALPLDPGDLRGMFDRLGGELSEVRGARLRDYRALDGGFRFELTLAEDFRVAGRDVLGVRGRAPGSYLVTYDGAYRLEPLTSPLPVAELAVAPARAAEETALTLRLRNEGLEDLPAVTVEVWAQREGGKAQLLERRAVDLLAGAPLETGLAWTPHRPGAWRLWLSLSHGGEAARALSPSLVEVGEPVNTGLLTGGPRAAAPLAAAGLGALALVGAALTFGYTLRLRKKEGR